MSTNFKPMLGRSDNLTDQEIELLFTKTRELWCSPKIDGIRCIVHPTLGPVSRSLKPIRNDYIRNILLNPMLRNLDGELTVDSPTAPNQMQLAMSGVTSKDGEPNFQYHVFDHIGMPICPYAMRYADAHDAVQKYGSSPTSRVQVIQTVICRDLDELLEYEAEVVGQGYEGIMVRDPNIPYKFNRSSLNHRGLMKRKGFMDDEAIVVGWEPLLRNQNTAYIDHLGLQKRSAHQENKIADNSRMGKLLVKGVPNSRWANIPFSIGSGFDDSDRLKYAANPPINQIVTYKYQPHGSKDAPRIPIFKGFRHADDLTNF